MLTTYFHIETMNILQTILDMEKDGTLAAVLVPYTRKPGESEESFKMQVAWQTMVKGRLLDNIRRAMLPPAITEGGKTVSFNIPGTDIEVTAVYYNLFGDNGLPTYYNFYAGGHFINEMVKWAGGDIKLKELYNLANKAVLTSIHSTGGE